jgi:hypothetical protein
MMEIRVAVPDDTCGHGLMRRLAGLFDRSSVSFAMAELYSPAFDLDRDRRANRVPPLAPGPPFAVCSRGGVAVTGRAAIPVETQRRGVVA